MTQPTVRATGIAWFRREDYNRCRKLFVDGRKLPETYSQWLKQSERLFQRFTESGHIVEKVYIDPDTFPAWCATRGLDVDAHARTEFASWSVARKYQNQS